MQYTTNFSLKKPQYGDTADIADINDNSDSVDNLIHQNRTMLAPAFSSETAYVTGDIVVYSGELFIFTADKAAGAWDATKVEPTTLGEECGGSGASALEDLTDVDVDSPADGDLLKWDDTEQKWVNGVPVVTKTVTGNPIVFDDGADAPAVECLATVEANQDLHGYSAPWVGGAGKNKININHSYSDTQYGVTVEVTDNGEIWVHGTPTITAGYISFTNVGPVSSSVIDQTITFSVNTKTAGVGFIAGSSNGAINLTLNDTVTSKTGVYVGGAANSITVNVRFDVGNIDEKYKIQIELGSTATTWEPYSNICPISGMSEVDITDRGSANIWDEEWEQGSLNGSTGEPISSSTNIRSKNFIPVNNANQYMPVYSTDNNHNFYFLYYDENENYIGTSAQTVTSQTPFIPNVSGAILMKFTTSQPNGVYANNISINYPSSITSYVPYKGYVQYIIDLNGTRYGGTVDVVRGVLTLTHGYADLSTLGWNYISANDLWVSYTQPTNFKSGTTDIISEKYPYAPFSLNDTQYGIRGNLIYNLWCRNYDSVNAPDGDFVYELAEPVEVDLTPTAIRTLLGDNYISTNAKSLSLEYITQPYNALVPKPDYHVYSTAEKVVGKWIDGKDLYEKTFSLSTSMTSGTYSQLDISSLNIDKFVSAEGVFNRIVSNLVFWYKFGGYEGSSYYSNIRYDSSSKTLDYIVGFGMSESCNEQIITIRYTKTASNNRSLSLSKGPETPSESKGEELPFEPQKAVETPVEEPEKEEPEEEPTDETEVEDER